MAFLGLNKSFVIQESPIQWTEWGEEWANRVDDAFEKLVSENSKKHLNEIKKNEVSAIRRE